MAVLSRETAPCPLALQVTVKFAAVYPSLQAKSQVPPVDNLVVHAVLVPFAGAGIASHSIAQRKENKHAFVNKFTRYMSFFFTQMQLMKESNI